MNKYSNYYPCIIFLTRYQGTYEKNIWACIAFSDYIPSEAIDDDVTCCEWWASSEAALVGRGSTPDLAYEDMSRRHEQNQEFPERKTPSMLKGKENVSHQRHTNVGIIANMVICHKCQPEIGYSESKTYYYKSK